MLISLLTFSKEIPKLLWEGRGGGGYGMPIEEVHEWGELRPKLDVYG